MNVITNEFVMREHIEKLGIQGDDILLDFGCGDGTYTIPFARMLGSNGKIFAIDKDQLKLDELREKAIEADLEDRINIVRTTNELEVPLKKEIIHLTLLYNVAYCIHGKDNLENLMTLVKDIYRVTKDSGRLIINVKGKHIENRIDNALPSIQKYFILEEKESKKYFLDNNRARNRFFYYFLKKSKNKV